jgi:hypothetical protein
MCRLFAVRDGLLLCFEDPCHQLVWNNRSRIGLLLFAVFDIPHMFLILASLLTTMLSVGGRACHRHGFASLWLSVSMSLYVRWGVGDLRRMVNAFVNEILIVWSLVRCNGTFRVWGLVVGHIGQTPAILHTVCVGVYVCVCLCLCLSVCVCVYLIAALIIIIISITSMLPSSSAS